MISFKTILVPTDFSDASHAALRTAVEMAAGFHAKLILLHVYEHLVYYSDMPMGMTDIVGLEQSVRSSAEQSLKSLLETDVRNQCECETVLVQGKPFVEIIRIAKEKHADLIVMSTHGRGGIEHMLLGSVTEKVVRKAPCAVLTLRAQRDFKMP